MGTINLRVVRSTRLFSAGILVLSLTLSILVHGFASADLGQAMIRFDRMQVSTPTTGTICAKPNTVASTESSVQVTFPTGYTLGTAANFTVSTTNLGWPTSAVAWPGVNTATNVTGQVVTFPSTDLTSSSTLYCFNWTNSAAVSVQATPSSTNTGTIATYTSTPTLIDSSGYNTSSVSGDQITVTASVPSTFSFALSGTTDSLTLGPSIVGSSTTPRTATVSTNAKNGWEVWAKDSNTGLTSTTASKTIASRTPGTNSTLSTGAEGYNTGLTSSQVGGSGTISIAAPFVGTATGQGGGLDTTLRPLATSGGTADTAVLTIKNNATISAITPAATDYTDVITVVGAGLF